ncbi:MAG: hypothetical protein F4X57_02795 [Chloroflexi bacterium]|nr:hypothetical protein [Chloroflexota bacterium]
MSRLTAADKMYLEKVFGMSSGYVLHFSDATFGQFFSNFLIDIHCIEFQTYGTSKANKLRAFWDQETDTQVGQVLSEMIDVYEAQCALGSIEMDSDSLKKCREIVSALNGIPTANDTSTEEAFLNQEFEIPDIQKLPVDFAVSQVIRERLHEVQLCLQSGANLSVIFLCGSILEAVLLGAAHNHPERFNRSPSSPKRNGRVKPFPEWYLSELIDVAHKIGLLKLDVHKFGHGLREFRNYIHPYEQLASRFTPDEHTAKICFQVLKAALADVAGERS